MFGRRKQTSTRIDTLLGKTANLQGDLEFSGGLHLDGHINGNVRSSAADGGALSVSETGFIEGRVAELEDKIARAEVIDVSKLSGKQVKFGATITVVDEDTDEKNSYQIVGPDEADVGAKRLSITSPLARAVIGKKVGDTVEVRRRAQHAVVRDEPRHADTELVPWAEHLGQLGERVDQLGQAARPTRGGAAIFGDDSAGVVERDAEALRATDVDTDRAAGRAHVMPRRTPSSL